METIPTSDPSGAAYGFNFDRAKAVKVVEHSRSVNCLQVAGGSIFTGGGDNRIVQWLLEDGTLLMEYSGHEGYVACITVVKKENVLYSGSYDRTVRCWNIDSGACLRVFKGHRGCLMNIQLSRHTNGAPLMITGSWDKTVLVWSLSSGKYTRVFTADDTNLSCFAVRGQSLFVNEDSIAVQYKLWGGERTVDKTSIAKYVGHSDHINCMYIKDSQFFTGAADSEIRIWEVDTGVCQHVLLGHLHWIWCLCMSGGVLFSGSRDTTVCAWDPSSGEMIRQVGNMKRGEVWDIPITSKQFTGHGGSVFAIQIAEEYMYTGGADETVVRWRVRDAPALGESAPSTPRSNVSSRPVTPTKKPSDRQAATPRAAESTSAPSPQQKLLETNVVEDAALASALEAGLPIISPKTTSEASMITPLNSDDEAPTSRSPRGKGGSNVRRPSVSRKFVAALPPPKRTGGGFTRDSGRRGSGSSASGGLRR